MIFPTDENGRYWIPAAPSEARVVMDCSCGYGVHCPERVWDHISGQHAAAHNKGRDRFAAASRWEIHHLAAWEPSPARGDARPGRDDRGAIADELARVRAGTSDMAPRRAPTAATRGRAGARTRGHPVQTRRHQSW